MKRFLIALCIPATLALAADKLTAPQLIELAKSNPANLREALVATLGQERIHNGTALVGRGPDFIWAVESASRPVLTIDDAPGPAMQRIANANIWYAFGKLGAGTGHEFEYRIDGKPFGGSKDVAAFGPESYLKPGVPSGKLEHLVHTSKIYEGMKSDYWIYVPAEYDPNTPAALMVFQDGQGYVRRESEGNVMDVLDNLIYEKKIPVMIAVFIQPGNVPEGTPIYKELLDLIARMAPSNARPGAPPPPTRGQNVRVPQGMIRSLLYDTVSDRYVKFLRNEFLPEAVYSKYNVRKDGYSHAISGSSSGGICAFNAAWQAPSDFSRVLSWIGSFMSIQQAPNYGGQAYPAMVQRDPIRNIRVWLQDGENDQHTWPMQTLNMANSLKEHGYDFHLSYGYGTHNSAQGRAEFPQSLTWLWRGYDPARTEQAFEQDPAEAAKPLFRVRVYNRDHGPEY
ncbi:MAG: alpha/beta hydrolase-fold protein [Bryobacteraceae bacterium]|jgi:enterochelin esterase family protein